MKILFLGGNFAKAIADWMESQGKMVTVETVKDTKENLADFEEDIACIKRVFVASSQRSISTVVVT